MENKKNKRPFLTIKEAIIGVAIIIFTAIAFGKPVPLINIGPPPPPERSVSEEEVKNFSSQLIEISSQEISDTINNKQKPTLMVLYASWCGYCKVLLPNISTLKKERKLEGVNLLLISVDKERNHASKYILEHNYDKIFTPYIIVSDEEQALKDIIKSKGGNYTRAIPYNLIFDENGNLLEESVGIINKKTLLRKLENAINKPITR